jgi:hypothetical protein
MRGLTTGAGPSAQPSISIPLTRCEANFLSLADCRQVITCIHTTATHSIVSSARWPYLRRRFSHGMAWHGNKQAAFLGLCNQAMQCNGCYAHPSTNGANGAGLPWHAGLCGLSNPAQPVRRLPDQATAEDCCEPGHHARCSNACSARARSQPLVVLQDVRYNCLASRMSGRTMQWTTGNERGLHLHMHAEICS